MELITKKCSKCGEVKEAGEFYAHKVGRGGITPRCKSCLSNAAKLNRLGKAPKKRPCTDNDRARVKKYRTDNKALITELSNAYDKRMRDTVSPRYAAKLMRMRTGVPSSEWRKIPEIIDCVVIAIKIKRLIKSKNQTNQTHV